MNSSRLREMVVNALKGKTAAEDKVYSPRDWPTHTDLFPVILVSAPYEKKNSLGRNAPQFHTVTTVVVDGRVVAYDTQAGVSGEGEATAAIESLKDEIERYVINNTVIMRNIQQFVSVESQTKVDASGDGHVGQVVIHFNIEYYQGPEEFYPLEAEAIKEINIEQQYPDGTYQTGISIKLEQ